MIGEGSSAHQAVLLTLELKFLVVPPHCRCILMSHRVLHKLLVCSHKQHQSIFYLVLLSTTQYYSVLLSTTTITHISALKLEKKPNCLCVGDYTRLAEESQD